MLVIERGNARSLSLEESLWKSLWTSRKTDYVMNATVTLINLAAIRLSPALDSLVGLTILMRGPVGISMNFFSTCKLSACCNCLRLFAL